LCTPVLNIIQAKFTLERDDELGMMSFGMDGEQ